MVTGGPENSPNLGNRLVNFLTKLSKKNWAIARNFLIAESIKWALAFFRKGKSPGADGIFPTLLQQGGIIVLAHRIMEDYKSNIHTEKKKD